MLRNLSLVCDFLSIGKTEAKLHFFTIKYTELQCRYRENGYVSVYALLVHCCCLL